MKKSTTSAKRFTTGRELKEFARLMQEKRELDAKIRECKDRAAATLGAADTVTIGGVTLSRKVTRMLSFSKDECVRRYGASLYEACKIETSRTTFEIVPASKH